MIRSDDIHVGSFTGERGEGSGISLLRRDPATGALRNHGVVAETASPSFLAWHPSARVLYAISELAESTVTAFAVDGAGGLRELSSRPSGGAAGCHLAVDPTGRYVLAAHFASGSVSVHRLAPDAAVAERTDLVHHEDVHADRRESHVHQIRVDPTGNFLVVTDLGLDLLIAYRLDPGTGRLAEVSRTRTAPGAGPRHLVFDGTGNAHVAAELNATVVSFRYADGGLRGPGRATNALFAPAAERCYPSEIAFATDGRFLYVANRGPDVVTTFAVDGARLRPVADTPTGGAWPRHIAVVGEDLYVANERSHRVTHFRLDRHTGVPVPVGHTEVGSPACILPAGTATGG
jgi:6-phosphogluconolactonase (cycloisomerase 2 family)